MSSPQPFYHLRPNKNIDRRVFVQTLIGLNSSFDMSEYSYTGFGSFLFDDFKMIHDGINISKMISLENDNKQFRRAKFNVPYSCIELVNKSSSEYISNLVIDDSEHNIFWLDYVDPSEIGKQIADFSAMLNRLNPRDVIRLTLNANPSCLGKSSTPDDLANIRFEKLKERVPPMYFPSDVTPNDLTTKAYPLVILRILKAIVMQTLPEDDVYSPNFFLPLYASVYADGQQMLTFTGIILDNISDKESVEKSLKCYDHVNYAWNNPCIINIPALSVREITELGKLMPGDNAKESILSNFDFVFSPNDEDVVNSYISYYKYYPNYHQVSF